MPPRRDIAGLKTGRLLVRSDAGNSPDGRALWLCDCDCGRTTVVRAAFLTNGTAKSCGCLRGRPRKHPPRPTYNRSADYSNCCVKCKRELPLPESNFCGDCTDVLHPIKLRQGSPPKPAKPKKRLMPTRLDVSHLSEDWQQEQALAMLEGRVANRKEFLAKHSPREENFAERLGSEFSSGDF